MLEPCKIRKNICFLILSIPRPSDTSKPFRGFSECSWFRCYLQCRNIRNSQGLYEIRINWTKVGIQFRKKCFTKIRVFRKILRNWKIFYKYHGIMYYKKNYGHAFKIIRNFSLRKGKKITRHLEIKIFHCDPKKSRLVFFLYSLSTEGILFLLFSSRSLTQNSDQPSRVHTYINIR